MRFLTEDGSYNISQETRGLILQEFLGQSVSISHTPSVSVSVSTSRSVSVSISHTPNVVFSIVRGSARTALISQSQTIVVLARKARTKSVSIEHTPLLVETVTTSRSTQAQITSRALVATAVGGVKTRSAVISHTPSVTLDVEGVRPEPIVSFEITSRSSSVGLAWQVGNYTHSVRVYKSLMRGTRTLLTNKLVSDGLTYIDGTNSADTEQIYAYQVVPVGVTGKLGKASNIIYTTQDGIL